MPGLPLTRVELPHPARLALRFVLVATPVLWLGYVYAAVLVDALLPVLRSAFSWFGRDFTLLRMNVVQQDGFGRLVLAADFAHPIIVNGQTIQPLSWSPQGLGWYEITLTLGSVLTCPMLLLIVVLAWPSSRLIEMLARIGLATPLAALLLLTTTLTQIAELWFPIHNELEPRRVWPLLLVSRFLMSGGGLMLAATLGISVVAITRRFGALPLPHD
jgi:hypothetical protein